MKSILANIGEAGLSADALKLEQAGRAEDVKAMMAGTPAFLEALRKVIENNKPKEEDEDATVQEDSDNMQAFLGEKLLSIQKACEEYDKKTAKTELTELRQKKWSFSTRELLDAIAKQLLHGEFEVAAKLAKDYVKQEYVTRQEP
jgi:hypothetical protein